MFILIIRKSHQNESQFFSKYILLESLRIPLQSTVFKTVDILRMACTVVLSVHHVLALWLEDGDPLN
jgi:hypothetical protein